MLWSLEGNQAKWCDPAWDVVVGLDSPGNGIQICSKRAGSFKNSPLTMLRIRTNDASLPNLADCYVRQQDLVAVYPEQPPGTFGLQLDYRVCQPNFPGSMELELWISVQTGLLDSHPSVSLSLGFGNSEPQCFAIDSDEGISKIPHAWHEFARDANVYLPTAFAGQPSDSQLNAAVVMHPFDQADMRISPVSNSLDPFELRFVDHFMEKGVIRRVRVRLIVATEKISHSDLKAAYQEFAESPLPLTA